MKKILITGLWYSGSSAVCDLLRQHEQVWMMPDNRSAGLPEFHAYALGWFDEIASAVESAPEKKLAMLYRNLINTIKLNPFQNVQAVSQELKKHLLIAGDEFIKESERIFQSKSKNGLRDSFLNVAADYIEKISDIPCKTGKENITHVIFDQAIKTYSDFDVWPRVFKESKLIIMERDILDQIADCQEHSTFFWIVKGYKDIKKFIEDQERERELMYSYARKMNNVKVIKFEDLVKNYQKTKNEIFEFVGIDAKTISNEGEHFDPLKSLKNIGKYKQYLSDQEIIYAKSQIEKCRFCYTSNEQPTIRERLSILRKIQA
ncbi:sulfotransferase [Marinospirillum alkaliphilum]|uniref:Sulfotransferase domain-containing protein n=1 Tax=Marinospirillum alkaliphilum DSM 21637 TaxID=1122209 RepID=A0A1K1VK59_9GAMM|nr:sulfotransferase [Marinospirillum alkaliphilum]SFX25068.1 Sulfotransferase domain-containing protein [Marinospirillum alkaliphilum DSM 21637]